jgi:hypothetical protein
MDPTRQPARHHVAEARGSFETLAGDTRRPPFNHERTTMQVDLDRFHEVVAAEGRGEIIVGVDRPSARKFYTDVPAAEIRKHTGAVPYIEMAITRGALFGSPICLIVAEILSIRVLGWWSVLAILASVAIWFTVMSSSPRGDSNLAFLTGVLVASFLPLLQGISPSTLALTLLGVSLWLARFTYVFSTSIFRGYVLSNPLAFEWLHQYLVIRDAKKVAG